MRNQKPNGYWTDETILSELKQVISKINHFPSRKELMSVGLSNLDAQLAIHGGHNKFRELLGYQVVKQSKGYWTDERIISELKEIASKICDFPSRNMLIGMGYTDLDSMINRKGGYNKYRVILGYSLYQRPNNYWVDETIIPELKLIISNIDHFPTADEIRDMGREDLVGGIYNNGGLNRYRELLGYPLRKKSNGYWTDERIVSELKIIISNIGHFPTNAELDKIDQTTLASAISENGGINKFRMIMNYPIIQHSTGYWTDERIALELKSIISNIGHFPIRHELTEINHNGLVGAIGKSGGINKYRCLLGYPIERKPNKYWTEDKIIPELKEIIQKIGHFPTQQELYKLGLSTLSNVMNLNGGSNKFRELLGYNSAYEKFRCELASYSNKRGIRSERIVKQIITKWAIDNGFPKPIYNKKLTKANVIEFVCNTGKTIGIDVTNTRQRDIVAKKWRKEDYHKHLDELWIVVFSDSFNKEDYNKWNKSSPDNVKVMSITTFIEELDYSIDENIKTKIDKLNKCTFRTKEQLKNIYVNHEKPRITLANVMTA